MKNKNIKLFFLAAALLLTGCNSSPTSSSENSEFTSSEVSENTSSEEILYENQITITQALEIARQAGSAGTSSKYTVIGTIKVIESTQYGDMIISDGTEVIVSGVVVASIVNQSGFYIQDETGIITVIGSEDMVSSLSIGDSIIIKGVKGHKMKTGVSLPGQICILDAELISNFHGGNSWSTDKFITGKNLEFLKTLNATNDKHSTEVYIVKATINIIETPYFTSINLIDGNTSFDLYCSGAGQYSFLKAYSGQEVTLEINPCNYNGTYYKGCVLAVIDSDNVKTINQLNFSK